MRLEDEKGVAVSDKAETKLQTESTLYIQVEECLSGVIVSSLCEDVEARIGDGGAYLCSVGMGCAQLSERLETFL